MRILIFDDSKFKQLKHNRTKAREDSLSAYLRKFRNAKIIDDVTFHKILLSGFCPGILYGSQGRLSFPPYSGPSTPTGSFNLASYLVDILRPISTNQHTIKDSFSFFDWAKQCNHYNGIMCSLDVSSLFIYVSLKQYKFALTSCTYFLILSHYLPLF